MGSAARSLAWRRCALLFIACCPALMPSAAVGGEATAALGNARVQYDDTRWQAADHAGRIMFTPVGEEMRSIDPVVLRIADDGEACAALALQAFEAGHYDTARLTPTPVIFGGVSGERFAAHTGCRNATPQGVVICVKAGGFAYLLKALNPGCTGRNLFSGVDPLAEIADGIRFETSAE